MSFHQADRPTVDETCGIVCRPSAERPAIVMVRASPRMSWIRGVPRRRHQGGWYVRLARVDDRKHIRIASPEMLPLDDLLPHVICSPPVFAGGGEHEAYQHDDA
jgi:hypothetical protein